jgi:hypothetical protein
MKLVHTVVTIAAIAVAVVSFAILLMTKAHISNSLIEAENRLLMRSPIEERRIEDLELRVNRLEGGEFLGADVTH